jgi:hypothetical protein
VILPWQYRKTITQRKETAVAEATWCHNGTSKINAPMVSALREKS